MDTEPVSVTGGSGGVAADCAELVALARRFGDGAHDTLGSALTLHGCLLEGGLVTSAALDPVGFAEFEADLLLALDGPRGLTGAGLQCGAIDGELRLAASAYREADRLAGATHDLVLGAATVGPALAHAAAVLARTGSPVAAAEAVIADDPALADVVIDAIGLPGLLAATARAVPDGHGVARDTGLDPAGGPPPRLLTDLLADLSRRNGDTRHGEIDVRFLTLADGTRRVIVDITGTKSWDPLPTADVTSLTTNGRALVGVSTAYETGVLAAMRRAGVRATDDVMLVGHSEGGMVAVTTARDAVRSGEFRVTHVITAGSPVGRTVGQVPRQVQVLALENGRDVVPHLDGTANPDEPNITTARSAHGDGTVAGDHSLEDGYLPVAADAQTSTDRSIRDFLASADGYFQATSVQTHTFQIRRSY